MKILFVCMGNICRSPAAENVMARLLEKEGLSGALTLDSAGTIGYHAGNPPDSRMTAAAARRGIPMTGRARRIRTADLTAFDLILVMDEMNRADIHAMLEDSRGPQARVRAFCEFCTEHDASEVPDPYYGGDEGFEKVLDLLEDGCRGILQRWRAGELKPVP